MVSNFKVVQDVVDPQYVGYIDPATSLHGNTWQLNGRHREPRLRSGGLGLQSHVSQRVAARTRRNPLAGDAGCAGGPAVKMC